MFEHIRRQLVEWFQERHLIDQNTQGILVSSVAKKIQALMPRARRYHLIKATDDVFEIFSTETLHDYIVTVNARTCSCREWQDTGIPIISSQHRAPRCHWPP